MTLDDLKKKANEDIRNINEYLEIAYILGRLDQLESEKNDRQPYSKTDC